MTERSQEEIKTEIQEKVDKGRFDSIFDEYPGYIQFPCPLMLHHVTAWWSVAVEANKTIDAKIYKYHINQWHAVRDLLLEFDGWHLDNLPAGDVKEDRVPQIIVTFVTMMGEEYIRNQLSPKLRGVLRTSI